MEMTLGEMLKRFRIEKEIKAEDICEGLCSRTMISYFENGEKIPDTLLFIRFMERMGVSPEYFAIMVSEEEYDYFLWRERIWDAIEDGNWDELGGLLKEKKEIPKTCNDKLAEQYEAYVKAIYFATVEKRYKEATILLESAIKQTIPDVFKIVETGTFLGTIEIHMLLLYFYYGKQGEMLHEETTGKLFEALERYVNQGPLEIGEKVKIYPKLVCMGMEIFKNSITVDKQFKMCKQAVELLRKNKNLYDITTLLQNYISLYQNSEDEEVRFYRKQYESFSDILAQGGAVTYFKPEVLSIQTPKFYLIHEYLYSKRKEKNITQEVLSERICEPETYSRIEGGTRAPAKKKFIALAEKLEIHWHYYRGELETCELEAFRLRKEHRWAEIEERYEDSLCILEELEAILDMDSLVNYQYVESQKCMNRYRLNQITAHEAYERLGELLRLTKQLNMDTKHIVYYSQTELEIITDQAKILRKENRMKEGIILLETILMQMQRSKVKFEQQWNGVDYALRTLSSLYFSVGKHRKSNELLEYVYKVNIKMKHGDVLMNLLDAIADNLEHIGEQYSEDYKKLYRQAYYAADFYYLHDSKDFFDSYYRDKFEPEIRWY